MADTIKGYIERITFYNPDTGYAVAQLKEKGKRDLTCLVGHLPGIQPGETLICEGSWKTHLVHGRQFEVEQHKTELPADIVGISKYLGSGLIKGIGPVYASRIVEKFGTETLEVIDQSPDRLLEIPGIGKGRIDQIKQCWSAQRTVRDVMLFLQTYSVSPAYAQKIYKTYADQSIAKVKENPFNLARDIFGIGFKTADAIAQKMGIKPDAPERIDAGIEHILGDLSGDGHVCYPVEEAVTTIQQVLEAPEELVRARLDALHKEERIVIHSLQDGPNEPSFVWLKPLYMSEIGIARELKRIRNGPCHLRTVDVDKALDWAQKTLNIQLAPNQINAVSKALTEKLQIITGGPGTGKSTIIHAILAITQKLTDKILLAAPTGRAAKRVTEITGRKASTIHSLLEFDFKNGGFKRNRQSPLECDLLIIDESSMIDTHLMFHLLKAVPNNARLVFVGDINQLPSVGPGNVLKDLIASRKISVTMLHEIFRQAAGSYIITNAHRINDGLFPSLENVPSGDFFFLECIEPEQVLSTIVELVSERLPKRYGFDRLNDIQVLAPMRRGIIGIENMNTVLQQKLNPGGEPLVRFGRSFKVGDKVMQLRNDYNREVFNGDVGRITRIEPEDEQLSVIIDGREIIYEFSDLDDLVLAYAASIHKSQGSEFPCVVIPVHTQHFKLLHRNLLYTGVTRGKRLVILVGTKKALSIAVSNDEVKRRYTGLRQALT